MPRNLRPAFDEEDIIAQPSFAGAAKRAEAAQENDEATKALNKSTEQLKVVNRNLEDFSANSSYIITSLNTAANKLDDATTVKLSKDSEKKIYDTVCRIENVGKTAAEKFNDAIDKHVQDATERVKDTDRISFSYVAFYCMLTAFLTFFGFFVAVVCSNYYQWHSDDLWRIIFVSMFIMIVIISVICILAYKMNGSSGYF
jgi:rubrerythrin